MTNVETVNKTLTSLELSWNLPLNVNYDHIELKTFQVDTLIRETKQLDKNEVRATINGLKPGTTIQVNINTVMDKHILASVFYTDINGIILFAVNGFVFFLNNALKMIINKM